MAFEHPDDREKLQYIFCQDCHKCNKEVQIVAFCEEKDCIDYLCSFCIVAHARSHLVLNLKETATDHLSQVLQQMNAPEYKTININLDRFWYSCWTYSAEVFDSDHILICSILGIIILNTESELMEKVTLIDSRKIRFSCPTTVVAGRAFAVAFRDDGEKWNILIVCVKDDKKSVMHQRSFECSCRISKIRYMAGKLFVASENEQIEVISLQGKSLYSIWPDIPFRYFDVYNDNVFVVNGCKVHKLSMVGDFIETYKLENSLASVTENLRFTGNGRLLVDDKHSDRGYLLTLYCKQLAEFQYKDKSRFLSDHIIQYCDVSNTLFCLMYDSVYKIKF